MADLVVPAAAAAGVFVVTDLDDLAVLTVLFLSSRTAGRPRAWQIWVGQYAGIAILVGISAVAAIGLAPVPDRWVGLLGLVPFAMGLWGLVGFLRGEDDDAPPGSVVATGVLSVATITVANGADNISVYTPIFRTIGLLGSLLTIAIFAVGVALWCALASWLSSHRAILRLVERHGDWIVPVVFMVVGAVIVLESGLLG